MRIRLSTVQIIWTVILFITPLILLFMLKALLPDEGSIDAIHLDRIFWTITLVAFLTVIMVILGLFIVTKKFLFTPVNILAGRARDFAEGRPVLARERFVVSEIDHLADSVNMLMDAVTNREESLLLLNEELEDTVSKRTMELQESIEHLRSAREQLILSEKMMTLGSLVTGVAHELNSPLSIGVTAASFLNERSRAMMEDYEELALTQENLERFLADSEESSQIIQGNLDQAARIIGSLKQVAADQQVDDSRPFELGSYISDILLSLNHHLRTGKHKVSIESDGPVTVDTYPGAITQILNNLVFNSVIHGFENREGGTILIVISKVGDDTILHYQDDGRGLNSEETANIFKQFYTTRPGPGGTGLGMFVVLSLVSDTLGGSIEIETPESGGTGFLIRFPADCNSGKGRV